MSSMSERERQDALDLIQAAHREMARRAKAPGWYHVALGLLSGGLAAAQELPMPWPILYYGVFCAALMLLIRGYRRHTGMWIPGYRAGRTRWVAFSAAAIVAVLFGGAALLTRRTGVHGLYAAAGALIAVTITAKGYLWEKAYRRDLGVSQA